MRDHDVERARRWQQHPVLLDVVVMAAVDVFAVATLAHSGETRWWVWLLDQGLVLPLVAVRRWPLPVFALVATLALIQWANGIRLVADVALLVALWIVATHRERRMAYVAAIVLEIGVVLASARFAPTGDGVVGSLIFLSGLVAAALFGGTSLKTRRDYLASLEDRALRLERERDQQAAIAATTERARIAREMHDIVAHSLAVMTTLADGAAMASAADDAEARQAMRQVAATGRQSLVEMRRLLGVLREESATSLAPQPTLATLASLIEESRAAGLPVTYHVSGAPASLLTTAEVAVYRLVQESLTNALKHADAPHEVLVALRWRADSLEVEVRDDGAARATREPQHAGHGLVGMRERLALFGGDVVAEAWSPRGWRVLANLPLDRTVAR